MTPLRVHSADSRLTTAAWLTGHCEAPSVRGDSLISMMLKRKVFLESMKMIHLQSPHSQSEVLMLRARLLFWKRSILLKVDFKKV